MTITVPVLSTPPVTVGSIDVATPHAWPGRLSIAVSLTPQGGGSWDGVAAVLAAHQGLVDAVVFEGEQPGLALAMTSAREFGYQVGLRTAGTHPHALAELLPLTDWVSIEIASAGCVEARSSLELIMRSGVDYEVTLAIDPATHSREDVFAVVREVIRAGAHAPVLCGRAMYEVINSWDLPDLERR